MQTTFNDKIESKSARVMLLVYHWTTTKYANTPLQRQMLNSPILAWHLCSAFISLFKILNSYTVKDPAETRTKECLCLFF